jgi:D-alanine transaminase
MDDTRTACLNGEFMPLAEARISPMDRGFLFGDGVYEVIPAYDSHFFRLEDHLRRLQNSLQEIRLDPGMPAAELRSVVEGVKERNGGGDLAVYIQISRGAPAARDLVSTQVRPTVFATVLPAKGVSEDIRANGVAAATTPDIRWGACHIKSTALLANVMAMQSAGDDAAEAIMIRDGSVTEGGSSNVFLVKDDRVLTAPRDRRILAGITRTVILEILHDLDIESSEADVPEQALRSADEIWISSSTREVWPVTVLDGKRVGRGVPGPLWQSVHARYQTIKRAR